MVIIIIDNIGVTVNKLKKYAPIAGYPYCIKAALITAQLMKERTRVIHILYFTRGIKSIKDSFKPAGMLRFNSLLAPGVEKVLQPFIFKGFYYN